ncbi:hypothetical protein RchiOBHm_Chr5g0047181 [Rosa chinensis]|uniref:Uncharacterized protein n=1 Tax=Rosa chinensis TaxID=74649 RepID=A0A2P6QEC1_ROSCH|nr:hypothetical protein RchiOBHm_Chr5g0047181 [Rosa chinensis]
MQLVASINELIGFTAVVDSSAFGVAKELRSLVFSLRSTIVYKHQASTFSFSSIFTLLVKLEGDF